MGKREAFYFVLRAADVETTADQLLERLKEAGIDAARQESELVLLRYLEARRPSLGDIYVAESAARALREQQLYPDVFTHSIPASRIPGDACYMWEPSEE